VFDHAREGDIAREPVSPLIPTPFAPSGAWPLHLGGTFLEVPSSPSIRDWRLLEPL